jgi:DNA-binding protein HU-beta
MKKQDFINAVHGNTDLDLSRKVMGEVIDTTFNEITNLLKEETGKFTYPGFGTFNIRHRAEREGVKPGTTTKITIPASNTVGFKVATGWKRSLTEKL